MPTPQSVADLIDTVAQQSPLSREAFLARLNPWLELEDSAREILVALLSAMARKRRDPVPKLATEALGHLGGKAGVAALITLVLDEALDADARRAAATALHHHAPEAVVPHTPLFDAVMVLQVQSAVKGVADGHEGYEDMLAQQIADAARRFGARGAVEPMAAASKSADLPLAAVLGRVFDKQRDPSVRAEIICVIARELRQESADFLAALEARSQDKDETKRIRKGLHALRAKGFKPKPVAAGPAAATAMVSGCDGDACAVITVFAPTPTGIDVISLVVHLIAGVRGGFVNANLPRAMAAGMKDQLRSNHEQLSATVPIRQAATMLAQAFERTPAAVQQKADLAHVYERLQPVLADAEPVAYPAVQSGAPTRDDAGALLSADGFLYWFFESAEDTMQPALQSLDKRFRARAEADLEKAVRQRFERAVDAFVAALVDTGERTRLAAMLRHQAVILEALGRGKKARQCMRFAHDLEQGHDDFLIVMATDSLLRALDDDRSDEQEWQRREQEALDGLRQVMDGKDKVVKRDILTLDLGAQLLATMVLRNRRLPSSQRAGLESLEQGALAMASAYIGDDKASKTERAAAALFRDTLDERALLPEAVRKELARELAATVAGFVRVHCGTCVHRCQAQPDAAAPGLLYATVPPWQVPAALVSAAPRRGAFRPALTH